MTAKKPRTAPPLDPGERARLLAGEHHDPHALLGAHPVKGGVAIRVLRPWARGVTAVLPKGRTVELHDDGDGLFSVLVPLLRKVPAYELRVRYEGSEVAVRDPYRHLPSLGDLDLHLIGEGRHEELWTALGSRAMTHEGVTGTRFAVWAPNARGVRVTGDFTHWDGSGLP
ncbi:1,4-alpha-glucan branching enzyme, partial [Streptomyces hydrogenans]